MNESVQKWLDELTAAPSTAIQKLVLGYAGVSAWSRSSLRESFVEIFQTHAETLDAAVAAWLQERLMKLPPEKTPTLVWASHLQDLFSALAGLPLPQVARLLRDRLRDFRSWLRPLRTDESLDPEAAYLAALAWADTNQHLEGMWQGLALRRDREPAYYTDIGLLGLRKTRDERGQLPSKAPFLLLATLIDLAETGLSQKDWLLTTRALLGGYHYSLETWVREFEPVLEARQDAEHGPVWLKEIVPLKESAPLQARASELGQAYLERSVTIQKPITGQRTVLSIDMVGYSRLAASAEAFSSEALMKVNVWIHRLIYSLVTKERGASDAVPMVSTGDGCLLFFSKPDDAVRFASEFREETHRQSGAPPFLLEIAAGLHSPVSKVIKWPLTFRIGIATGQVVLQGTTDRSGQVLGFSAVGEAIARSVRVQSFAKPGQILITSETFARLRPDFGSRFSQIKSFKRKELEGLDIGPCLSLVDAPPASQ